LVLSPVKTKVTCSVLEDVEAAPTPVIAEARIICHGTATSFSAPRLEPGEEPVADDEGVVVEEGEVEPVVEDGEVEPVAEELELVSLVEVQSTRSPRNQFSRNWD